MAGTPPNKNLPFLPAVPLDLNDTKRLRLFLTNVKSKLEGTIQNPDPPDQVTNLQATVELSGLKITWDSANKATHYAVYRAFNSIDWADSELVHSVTRDQDMSFFDVAAQQPAGGTRTYWVQAKNGFQDGLKSTSITVDEPLISGDAIDGGTGSSIGELLKNKTRQRQISPIGALTAAAAPSSTDTTNMKVTFGVAKNWPTGTRVTVNSTANGLTAGTNYYLGQFSTTIFAFYTTVQNAVDDVSRVTLTGSISATVTPDAVVFCTIPADAAAAALITFLNEGTAGNWLVRTAGVAPTTTVYSAKIGPGDSTLSTLGEGFSEENPPVGDVCVYHDDASNGSAGVLACYAGWNDGTSPLVGPTGPTGADGRGYKATSATSLTIANSGSVTFVTQTNLAYTVGARIRATSTGSAAWMEGLVTGYTEFVGSANLVVTMDSDSGSGSHSDWDINAAGAKGDTGSTGGTGATGATGPAGTGGSPSTNDFRLTLAPGFSVYRPQAATPSSTNTTTEVCTFAVAHGWVTGTICTIAATIGGLTAGTTYYINALSATTCSFYTTLANAIADTSRVNLTANVTNQINPSGITNTTLYLTPHIGNTLPCYVSSAWAQVNSAEISIALGTLTSAKNYDVFVYSNSGVLTIDTLVIWTDNVTRATALARQDGVWVKSGDSTRRYVGTIRTDSTTTTIDDGGGIISQVGGKRFVWNAYNRKTTPMKVKDGTANWSYAVATYRQANNNAGNKVEYITGLQEDPLKAQSQACALCTSGGVDVATAIGIDSTTVCSSFTSGQSIQSTAYANLTSQFEDVLSIGYHAINQLEISSASSATFYGTNDPRHSGLLASILM